MEALILLYQRFRLSVFAV